MTKRYTWRIPTYRLLPRTGGWREEVPDGGWLYKVPGRYLFVPWWKWPFALLGFV